MDTNKENAVKYRVVSFAESYNSRRTVLFIYLFLRPKNRSEQNNNPDSALKNMLLPPQERLAGYLKRSKPFREYWEEKKRAGWQIYRIQTSQETKRLERLQIIVEMRKDIDEPIEIG